jgi:transcriptional regulator with PAS, ATPase and Fis domain
MTTQAALTGLIGQAKEKVLFLMSCLIPERVEDLNADYSSTYSVRTNLQRLIVLRLIILSFIFTGCLWVEERELTSFFFGIVGFTYAISILNSLLASKLTNLKLAAYLQLSIDAMLATFAIVASQTFAMFSLYLLVIIIAALLLGRQGSILLSAMCGVCYSTLANGIFSFSKDLQLETSTADIFAIYFSLVLVALLSSYLTHYLKSTNEQLLRARLHAIKMNSHQQQLINGLGEGLITVNLGMTITSINEAAQAILGLAEQKKSDFLGKKISNIFKENGLDGLDSLLKLETAPKDVQEIAFQKSPLEPPTHINCNVLELRDQSGSVNGKILRFTDVSKLKNIEERLSLHEQMTQLLANKKTPEEQIAEFGSSAYSRAYSEMIGESLAMNEVKQMIDKVANSDASILITGESGTGKELIARSIHEKGKRRGKSFVAINCGAIPENLIESELFGHKKGSFTGAVVDKLGLFREANGGTVFLDEIGELPLHLQAKLLRVLQEKSVRGIGETKDTPINVRILAATNRNLKQEVEKLLFRDDLYYRLNVVQIQIPPLRERKQDIPLLVRHFLNKNHQSCELSEDEKAVQISPEAIQLLTSYNFPGNIRELENIIERALVLGGTAILPSHLPNEIIGNERQVENLNKNSNALNLNFNTEVVTLPIDLESELAGIEQKYLNLALEQSEGVRKRAAQLLGLNFRSLRYRLKKYGLSELED